MLSPELVTIAGFNLFKLGSLKRREQLWFVDRDKRVMSGLLEILRIAQSLALDHGIDATEAYEIVSRYGSSEMPELLVPYADRLAVLAELLGLQESTAADAVTMILQSRLENGWLAQNKGRLLDYYGIDVQGDGWSDSYTQELPEAVIDEIWQFLNNERNRWKEPENEVPESVEGKLEHTPNSSTEMTSDTGQMLIGRSSAA